MEFKRGISIGIIFYLISFTIGGILSLGFGFNSENITPIFMISTIISMIILTVIFSYWYFNKEDIKKGFMEGFKLGIIFLVVGTVIDVILLIIYATIQSDYSIIKEYYYSYLFLASLVSLLISATITGGLLKKTSKK